ncbi:hypothetical protein PM082_019962 [Marasmius tenuissimus]|nr:hypothetical protein PM082_019962 [Marasmius tenuissimus]
MPSSANLHYRGMLGQEGRYVHVPLFSLAEPLNLVVMYLPSLMAGRLHDAEKPNLDSRLFQIINFPSSKAYYSRILTASRVSELSDKPLSNETEAKLPKIQTPVPFRSRLWSRSKIALV